MVSDVRFYNLSRDRLFYIRRGKRMSKKSLFVVLLIGLMMALIVAPTAAQDKVTITWFVGLGTGTDPQQQDAQKKVVADFNASQDKINLVINIAANNQTAKTVLAAQLGTK